MALTNAEITERRAADLPDAKDVREYRAYAMGVHPEVLTVDQQRLMQQRAAHGLADNVIAMILKTAASRLRLTQWTVDSDVPISETGAPSVADAEVDRTQAWLNHLWLINRLKRLQYEVHYAQLRDGNSAVSMTYRNGMPVISREPWWDGETGAYIAYTDAGEYEFAVREWKQRENDGTITVRRTVYEPGMIRRYYQSGSGWSEYTRGEVQAEERWQRNGNEPLPIPWVHFPNGSAVTDTPYGQSDISTLLALQDDLNAVQRDLSAAALLTAFQRLFFAGVSDPKKISVRPGGATGDESPDAKVTAIPAGDMSQLTSVHTYKREAMLIASSTPAYTITGDWPSGEALMRADMKLIEKVEALADVAGPMWTMTAHRCMEIANAFGGAGLNEDLPITSVFAPAERIDEATQLDLHQRKADLWGAISRLPKTAMLKTGLVTEDEANEIIRERDAMMLTIGEM